MKKGKRRIALLLFCTVFLTGCAAADQSRTAQLAPAETDDTLEVFFFNVGKADSMLIRQGEHAMLIDAATDKAGAHVLDRLREEGVEKLDVLLITHEDKDHIGGADRIVRALPIESVYIGEIQEQGKQVSQFAEAMQEQGKESKRLFAGDHFALGKALVTVVGPLGQGYEQENDCSLVVRVDFGETSVLLAGDAEKPSLLEMLAAPDAAKNLRAQVLKVPHHGGIEDVSAAFFEAVHPEIAVIPCERHTDDRLPDEGVEYALERVGAQTYVTGDGEVKVVSDGRRVTATVHP